MNRINGTMRPIKWLGIKNSETGIVTAGYLFIHFTHTTALLNTTPGVIGATPQNYTKGQRIGFNIREVSTRREAIEKFIRYYRIIPQSQLQAE